MIRGDYAPDRRLQKSHGRGNKNPWAAGLFGGELEPGQRTIVDCAIGNEARISNIGVHIANYDICGGACIEDVVTMATSPGCSFGNGIEVIALEIGSES